MPETASEVLDLLSTAESRWRTLRASGREWRNTTVLSEAWQAQIARKRAEGQHIGTNTFQSDLPRPENTEEEWHLWLAAPWKRAQFAVSRETVDVIFHESTWWCNAYGVSRTNGGALNSGCGEGPGAELIRTADYVSLIDVGAVTPGSWLGRDTLNARASIRQGLERKRGRGLHGLVIGDPDEILLSVDRERGVILRTEGWFQGSVYRILDMNDVAFDEDFPPETFEIQPLLGLDWS